jgi:hypothetical protein
VETRNGVIAYAALRDRGLLYRTSDGGKTWREVSVRPPGPADPGAAMDLEMAIAPDGGVFIGSRTLPLYRSRPDGTGFVKVHGAPLGDCPYWKGERLMIGAYSGMGPTDSSADGQSWESLVPLRQK